MTPFAGLFRGFEFFSDWSRHPGNLISAVDVSTSIPKSPRPIFKPRQIKTADRSYWYIEAEWDDGTIEEIGEFKSISDAWDWIARESPAWLGERGNGRQP